MAASDGIEAPATGPRRAGATSRLGTAADPVAWLIAFAAFAAYTTISVFRYLRLDPGSWDLGIFTEYVKQYALLRPPVVDIKGAGFNLLGDHFTPIMALVAPIFRLFPTPVTLLVIQALLTALSVVPVCRAARELLGTGVSRAVGAAYGFSWGLQQMINFDVHAVAFAVPLLAFSLSALVRRRLRAAVLWALPLVFVKEDQGFTLAALGAVMLVAAARHWAARGEPARLPGAGLVEPGRAGAWARAGALLAIWGLAWSALAILVIIPHFNPAHHYPYWKNGGAIHPGGYLSVTGLLHQLGTAAPTKLRTLVLVLVPVLFLALRSPLALVAVPGLLLRFVSTDSSFWGTGFHYSATVMPIVFVAAIDALARISARAALRRPVGTDPRAGLTGQARARAAPGPGMAAVTRYSAALMLVVAAILAFRFPLASLWNSRTYLVSPHVRAEETAMARVPDGVTVAATLSMLAPLATRDTTYWIGRDGYPAPRYVVFDDAGSGWSPPPAHLLSFVDQRHPGTSYRQVFEASGVYVFRRDGVARGNG